MSELMNAIQKELGGQSLVSLAGTLGTDEGKTQAAIAAALPALLGGLAKNANASQEGAANLDAALEKDHSQPFASLGGLGALAGSLGLGGGGGILGHVLGNRQEAITEGVSKASGLDAASVAKLLPMLAPLVMSALGTVKQEKGLDGSGVASLLSQETEEIKQQAPVAGGLLGLLDQDGDGNVMDDLGELGAKLKGSGILGGLFG